jgi:hypothetical protein
VSFSKAAHLDTKSIAKVKTQIPSLPSTTLPILNKFVHTRAGQGPVPLSPLKVEHCFYEPFFLPSPQNKGSKVLAKLSQAYRW